MSRHARPTNHRIETGSGCSRHVRALVLPRTSSSPPPRSQFAEIMLRDQGYCQLSGIGEQPDPAREGSGGIIRGSSRCLWGSPPECFEIALRLRLQFSLTCLEITHDFCQEMFEHSVFKRLRAAEEEPPCSPYVCYCPLTRSHSPPEISMPGKGEVNSRRLMCAIHEIHTGGRDIELSDLRTESRRQRTLE